MMPFTFIHTADWQLGKSFGQFPPDVGGALRLARQTVITRIAAAADEVEAKHVFVAGDVWDSAIPSNTTLRQPLTIMGEAPHICWWLLPGNHDPDGPDGLWDRIVAVKPKNVKTLRSGEAVEVEPNVFVLPAPWTYIQHGQDLTDWMVSCETPEGALRIGIAHGGVRGFGSDGEGVSEIIPPDRAETARLDYLALGDWHAYAAVSKRAAYSGTPEPDRHKVGARGQVLAVTVRQGEPPEIQNIPTAAFDWPLLDLAFKPGEVEAQLRELTLALKKGHPLRQTHVRLNVSGELTVDNWAAFERFSEEMTGECASFDVRGAHQLRLLVVPEDIESLDAQGSVREAAETLAAKSEDANISLEDRQIASEALRLLFRYAGETI